MRLGPFYIKNKIEWNKISQKERSFWWGNTKFVNALADVDEQEKENFLGEK